MTGVWNDRAHCTRSRAVSVSEFQLVFLLRGGYRNWKGDAFRRFSIYSNIYHVPPFHWIPIWCTRCHPGARCLHLFKLAVACCTLNFSLHRVRVFPPARNSYFMLQPRCFIGRGGGRVGTSARDVAFHARGCFQRLERDGLIEYSAENRTV